MLDPKEKTLEKAIQFTHHAITESKKLDLFPLGIGIGTPGTVNLDKGLLIFAPNLQWHNVPFRAIFHKHTGLNVFVENDANGAAVAESLFGAGKGSKNFILIFAGVGIGSGLFLNGELYRGHIGFAGEIGHAPITAKPFESPCHGGNQGCWETYANKFAIIRRVQSRLDARRQSIIPKLMREKNEALSIELIREAAKLEDKETIEALKETGEAMGLGIATLASILNPEKVILGGPLSILGDHLLPAIESVIKKRMLPELRPNVDVLLSRFDKDASLFGAISIVVDNIYTNPSQAPRR